MGRHPLGGQIRGALGVTRPRRPIAESRSEAEPIGQHTRSVCAGDLDTVSGSEVVIHPNVFHRLPEPLHVREWQVNQTAHDLRILLGRPAEPVEAERLAALVTRDLRAAGAEPPPVHVELVDAVRRTKLGKAPLIKALRPGAAEASVSVP